MKSLLMGLPAQTYVLMLVPIGGAIVLSYFAITTGGAVWRTMAVMYGLACLFLAGFMHVMARRARHGI